MQSQTGCGLADAGLHLNPSGRGLHLNPGLWEVSFYHRQPNVMVACAQAHVAQAMDCIVVLYPKVGKCNQTNDTYTFKQSKILQISLQLR